MRCINRVFLLWQAARQASKAGQDNNDIRKFDFALAFLEFLRILAFSQRGLWVFACVWEFTNYA